MKREEKNNQTRRKITESALDEFNVRGYEAGSVNNIYQAGNISKGIIYHYFQSKDDLYVYCVEECFRALVKFLSEELDLSGKTLKEQLTEYFKKRLEFFERNPIYRRLFCEAVIMPPTKLKEKIIEKRILFDEFNIQVLRTILSKVNLRSDISREDVIRFFHQYQDFMSARYQMTDIIDDAMVIRYERDCEIALNIFLYGIIQSECSDE